MSDVIQTPDTPTAAQAAAAALATLKPPPVERSEADILAVKLNEQTTKVATLTEQLAATMRERDTFKESVAKFEPLAKEADKLRIQVEGFVNQGRESAIVDKLRTALPGAEPLAIRGVLSSLHESGKLNRYSEDAAAAAATAIELIKSEAPSLTRTPTGASGSAAVRETPAPARPKSFVRG